MRGHGWRDIQPSPCNNKQRIPQIHTVNIERCILGSARSSPSQIDLCFGKRNGAQEGRGLPFLCFCLSSVHYTAAGTSQKSGQMPLSHLAPNRTKSRAPCQPIRAQRFQNMTYFQRSLGLDFTKLQRKQLPRAPSHCLSCPLSATFTLVFDANCLSNIY